MLSQRHNAVHGVEQLVGQFAGERVVKARSSSIRLKQSGDSWRQPLQWQIREKCVFDQWPLKVNVFLQELTFGPGQMGNDSFPLQLVNFLRKPMCHHRRSFTNQNHLIKNVLILYNISRDIIF